MHSLGGRACVLDVAIKRSRVVSGGFTGKPYRQELDDLAATYAWAHDAAVSGLANSLANSGAHPLLAVGSGGSLSAAHLAAFLHERFSARPAKAVTPLLALASPIAARDLSVLVLSAGGRNPDVVGALRRIALREPSHLAVLSMAPESPLARVAASFGWVDAIHYDVPSGQDGFLATNSLLAFAVILARAYGHAYGDTALVPASYKQLAGMIHVDGCGLSQVEQATALLWARRDLIVLHGAAAQVGAADLESRFSEAALGAVLLADYRNFAHGRHHWLAKRSDSTAVLGLVTSDDRDLAAQTLSMLPSAVPCVAVDITAAGVPAMLGSLVASMHLAGAAGRARGIDPGRPGVPAFGRRIYGARALDTGHRRVARVANAARPIERKAGVSLSHLRETETLGPWEAAFAQFTTRLRHARFGALVLDYDGTLCTPTDRERGWSGGAPEEVLRLLRAGVPLGIATGRGDSVRGDLQRHLPEECWPRVLVGYHNGAEISWLHDQNIPENEGQPIGALALVAATLREHPWLPQLARISCGRFQVSVRPLWPAHADAVWTLIQEVARDHRVACLGLYRSGHSVDVVAPSVSKRALVLAVREHFGLRVDASVLCIGDRGRWPGNDGFLLAEPLSLSVDEVSGDPLTCWNLAPAGMRGVDAAVWYLRAVEAFPAGGFRLRLPRLVSGG